MTFVIRSNDSSSDTNDGIDPDVVTLLLSSTIYTTYFQVLILTLLVYDLATTMDKEVRYFWKTPRSVVNIAFFLNRYIGIMGPAAFLYCSATAWLKSLSDLTVRVIIDYILLHRVLALYCYERRLSMPLKILFVMEEGFRLGALIYLVHAQEVTAIRLSDNVTLCTVGKALSLQLLIIDWIIPLAYELLIMGLTLARAVEFWQLSAGFKGLTLVKIVVLDQIMYFALVIICCLFNLLQFAIREASVVTQTITYALGSTSFLCILGSRMLFNLKEAGQNGLNEGTSYRLTQTGPEEFEMRFA
ncbi:uncharacterized protein FOMMEDRAFT_134292 [Fomitiporia mediterranea MF3/22]|uniref:uncharacterized protein n=1 Tax=Fomitiporia mediterranea (strain MF3/22) TaxID=694068 RepID=UPI000440890D|nr:uncharacterized protein FOMMEDRAFT_134292 [Fomitiporia mediterranea MF3/22]EJD03182.1 hypothetical protein FOMMEDRAFT_134292 [Fomitiporia mediterranea MF3/22]